MKNLADQINAITTKLYKATPEVRAECTEPAAILFNIASNENGERALNHALSTLQRVYRDEVIDTARGIIDDNPFSPEIEPNECEECLDGQQCVECAALDDMELEESVDELRAEFLDNLYDVVSEVIDGHSWIIYNKYHSVITYASNADIEQYCDEPQNAQVTAFYLMLTDVIEALEEAV